MSDGPEVAPRGTRCSAWGSWARRCGFWQQADGVGEHVVGLLKGMVWPAFLVYDAFRALGG